MATARQWIAGARPRTLPAAIAPVLAGSGSAAWLGAFEPVRAALCLGVAVALQLGVNYANDYSDGVRGTDEQRVGPLRLVGSGLAAPRQVKLAAYAALAAGGVVGLLLAALSSLWLLVVGAAGIAAAWGYTGGKRPYGYRGLGEVSVFVFFGLAAVLGTTYAQAGRLHWTAICAAVGVGALACALLVANNLRDIPTDRAAGKRTLAVRLGDVATRRCYLALVIGALICGVGCGLASPWALLCLTSLPLLAAAAARVLRGAAGAALIAVLRDTGTAELLFGAGLAIGLALGAP